jgi:hypothetical protein
MFMNQLDNKGSALFHIMEHTNNSDVYRLLFDESNTEQVDTLLGTMDESLDAMGDWDNADSHYRFHSHEKVNIVGIQPRGEHSDFWKKHFAGFVKNPIPSVIDTSHLHQPPKGRENYNRVQPSYSDIDRSHGHNENDSDSTGPTAAETATQHPKKNSAKFWAQIAPSLPPSAIHVSQHCIIPFATSRIYHSQCAQDNNPARFPERVAPRAHPYHPPPPPTIPMYLDLPLYPPSMA